MRPKGTRQDALNRIWAKTDRRGGDRACWIWHGSTYSNGYGQTYLDGKRMSAHRAVYFLCIGEVSADLDICHTCDNPLCVNPRHLWIGTTKDNMDDKMRKGRGNQPKGEESGMSKLTEAKVREIRQRAAQGIPQSHIAKCYGVSQASVSNVIRMRTWRHVA